jgi:hypothetical protein
MPRRSNRRPRRGSSSFTNGVAGFQFAAGAHVALHENFQLGVEAGPAGQFYNYDNSGSSIGVVSIYSALVGTFVYPGQR